MQEPGALVDNKYEILAKVGEGGMSCVYLARDQRLNKQWAIKEVKQTGNRRQDELIAQSFITEANMMKKLDHPMLPRIVDIVTQDASIFVVMDYVEGQSLEQIVKQHGPQPQESVIAWGKDLSQALEYLHSCSPPIIYRDMKPANVMLKPDGTVRIIDFGIARELKEQQADEKVGDTTMLGTRGYAAPEQFGGIGQTDRRTDIYCLGATLYNLLTGKSPADPPYEMYPIRQIDSALSPGLEKIIATCTQQNPDARYQSCAELYYALENYERVDDAHIKRQQHKLRVFVALCMATVVLILGGIASLLVGNIALDNDYDAQIALAAASINSEQSADYYLDAINIRPDDTRAYLGLVALYKQDNQFTVAEEEQYSSVLLAHLEVLRSHPAEYADLAFETGRLYWHYFTYGSNTGDNQYTRVVSAYPWFLDAANDSEFANQRAARVYANVAAFEADITARINEGSDRAAYAPYFESLSDLNALAQEENNDVISLNVSKLTLQALEVYARKFRSDGIEEAQLKVLYDTTVSLLDSVRPSSVSLDELKEQIESRKLETLSAIIDAFEA
jgi:serine/threonine-protein kinase